MVMNVRFYSYNRYISKNQPQPFIYPKPIMSSIMGPPVINKTFIDIQLPVKESSLIFISLRKDNFFEYEHDSPLAELRFHYLFKGVYHNETRASNQIFKEILNHVKGLYNDNYFASLTVKDTDHHSENPSILITWRAYFFIRANKLKSHFYKFTNGESKDIFVDLTFQKGLTVLKTKKNKKMAVKLLEDSKVAGILFFARLVNIDFLGHILTTLEKVCHLKYLFIFYEMEGIKNKIISLCNNFQPVKDIKETYLIKVEGADFKNRFNNNIEFSIESEHLFS